MSGFAVTFNNNDCSELEDMIKRIDYRGPHIFGKFEYSRIMMAQKYLRADIALEKENMSETWNNMVPAFDQDFPELRICYDGQMGNWEKCAKACGAPNGPFREDRLFLRLYREHGIKMFDCLDDAIFAFVISDGKKFFAARDLLGIKTLFYGKKDNMLYFGSELKSIIEFTDEVYEFPPGHYMDQTGRITCFAKLPDTPPVPMRTDIDEITTAVRDIINRSFRNRIDFSVETGSLLSGGIDSSVITAIAGKAYRKKFGKNARIKTFALGVGESEDIKCARVMADFIGSDHHELIVDLEQMMDVLPEVIYYLESFDPSLVRSSVPNYLISRYAGKEGIEVLLSGEGSDEVFCGYQYFKNFSAQELFARQMECIGFLHNNASLRLDRMNLCNSIRVVAPLISGELLNYAMSIPPEYKLRPGGKQKSEKWIFRKAFEGILPEEIVWRLKQEFSQGSGSADVLSTLFEEFITDDEFSAAQEKHPVVRSKEELFYFRIFAENFGTGKSVETVGQWITL